MGRDTKMMHPTLFIKWEKFNKKMSRHNLPYIITSVDRNIMMQMALYAQGRMAIKDVNKFRRAAGLVEHPHDHYNKVVTWTLDSKHIVNPFDDGINNDLSRAFDIALLTRGGKVHWDLKISINSEQMPDYHEAGQIGKSVGLEWGGGNGDFCHFEIR